MKIILLSLIVFLSCKNEKSKPIKNSSPIEKFEQFGEYKNWKVHSYYLPDMSHNYYYMTEYTRENDLLIYSVDSRFIDRCVPIDLNQMIIESDSFVLVIRYKAPNKIKCRLIPEFNKCNLSNISDAYFKHKYKTVNLNLGSKFKETKKIITYDKKEINKIIKFVREKFKF